MAWSWFLLLGTFDDCERRVTYQVTKCGGDMALEFCWDNCIDNFGNFHEFGEITMMLEGPRRCAVGGSCKRI
jgi:hypothetical protein